MKRFYVVTGGPGAGKSTRLAALHRRGLHVSSEVGRALIRDEVEAGVAFVLETVGRSGAERGCI